MASLKVAALAVSLCSLLSVTSAASPRPYRVGVLAKNGAVKANAQWNSTFGGYLTQATGLPFEMVPLAFAEIYPAIADGEIDFVFTNPSMFVCAELWHSLQALATILNVRQGFALNKFGGVIFRSAARPDIARIEDLRGKIFEAVDSSSLGGFQMGWRQLAGHGLHPFVAPSEFRLGGTHDNVVMDVINGVVDVGTVRTDTLERMAAAGAISMDQVVILDSQDYQGAFPFEVSTTLYPEWNLAALDTVPEDVKRQVTLALMDLGDEPEHAAILDEAKIDSWVPALSYVPVYSALRDIGLVDEKGQCIASDSIYDGIACPKGYHKASLATVHVENCPEGRECLKTPCLPFCAEGLFDNNGTCASCPDGMTCAGYEARPVAKPGYMMLSSDPLSAYRCMPADGCPGGPPDSCSNGRMGIACASCPSGFFLQGGECKVCEGGNDLGTAGLWACVIVFSMLVFALTNGKVTARATPQMAWQGNTALLITFMQVIGILGFMDLRYPDSVRGFLHFFSKFALNVNEVLPVSCNKNGGLGAYVNTVLIFPVAGAGILWTKLLLDCLRLRWRMPWPKTVNSIGAVLMIGFTSIANVALTPLMCYSHPNGTKGLLRYPMVLCTFEGEHLGMVLSGLMLLLVALCYFAACIWVVLVAPKYTARGFAESATFHVASRHLTFSFRLDRWFWGIVLLPRGLALSFVPVVAADDSRVQAMLTVAIALVYVVFMMGYRPWRVPALTLLEATMWTSIILFAVFVGSFSPQAEPVNMKVYDALLVLVLGFINAILVVSLFVSGSLVLCRGRHGIVGSSFLMRRKGLDVAQMASEFVQIARGLNAQDLSVMVPEWQQADIEAMHNMLSVFRGNGVRAAAGPKQTVGRLQWQSGERSGSCSRSGEEGQPRRKRLKMVWL